MFSKYYPHLMTTVPHTYTRPDGRRLVAVQGDITEEDVDARL